PLAVGTPSYVITAPLFPSMTLTLPSGTVISMTAHRHHPAHVYVERVLIDGVPWDEVTVPHSTLVAGCDIEVVLSDRPTTWGAASRIPSLSHATPWRLADITRDAEVDGPIEVTALLF